MKKWIDNIKLALSGQEQDYTSGSIRLAIFLLAIPMMLEMVMESLFAVVDIFFVGKLGVAAVATVGLTESVITIIYAISIGLSMAATALVARRIGEKNHKAAADTAFQAIVLSSLTAIGLGILGYVYAADLLRFMGAEEAVISEGVGYTRIIFLGNLPIMLLFLINGIFRGAGKPAIAMRSLWLANGLNILLDPLLIFGIGIFPEMGIEGAAWATTIGRSVGVLYQLYHLLLKPGNMRLTRLNLVIQRQTVLTILRVGAGGMGQFLIESASWIVLTRIVASSGSIAVAGWTVAIRIVIFTLLPAMGLANAATTLVGQNLGAGHPDRAEASVWKAAWYNAVFLGICSMVFILFGDQVIGIFNNDPGVLLVGKKALFVLCLGYVFFAYGMVIAQSFNGAGDTFTPTLINIVMFWLFEIPLAWYLAMHLNWGASGVFWSVAIAHSLHALVSIYIFRLGRWKLVKV
ncbi:MAG: MATE family efflux transporter [Bacteroidia bacterium]